MHKPTVSLLASLTFVFVSLAACDKAAPPTAYPKPSDAAEPHSVTSEVSDDPTSPLNFKGKIAKRYADSEEWWPPTQTRAGTPNVVLSCSTTRASGTSAASAV